MTRIILGLFILMCCFTTAQIKFEKGYIITNDGSKSNVFIKNSDWISNPETIIYKLGADSQEIIGTPQNISEFQVEGYERYISYNGPIEQSSYEISSLSDKSEPIFKNEQVFLKEISSGDIKLYSYNAKRVINHFYSKDGSTFEYLVHKKYNPQGKQYQVATNEKYKTQLRSLFVGDETTLRNIKNTKYTSESLKKLFDSSASGNSDAVSSSQASSRKIKYNLHLRPGVNFYSPLKISNINRAENFPSKVGLRVGVEAEIILPFNKNKWSVIFEPNYNSYVTKKTTVNVENGLYNLSMDTYSFVNIPVGIRHHMFLSNKSSVFVNASLNIATIKMGKAEEFTLDYEGNIYDRFAIQKSEIFRSYAFGIGYNYNKKYTAEFRFTTNNNLLDMSRTPKAQFSYTSIVLGYNVF